MSLFAHAHATVLADLKRLADRGGDDRGAVLAIVAILMTVMMASAALAIDVGSFDQAQRQAQSAADAAALAAARGLPGTASSVTSIVQSYVAANDPNVPQTLLSSPSCMTSTTFTAGICIVSPYNSNSSQVQVRLFATSPSSFGKFPRGAPRPT